MTEQPSQKPIRNPQSAIRNRQLTAKPSCVLLVLLLSLPPAVRSATLDAAGVRKHLESAVGAIPWTPAGGYRLSGQFTLKVTGEEIAYQATYHRRANEWTTDFRQADHALDTRYGSGPQAWVSTPEVTAEVKPEQLPFCAQYDFPTLYSELLRILSEETRGPDFRLESDGQEVVVRGRLWNGLRAVYIFYATDYRPKKVALSADAGVQPAWLIPTLEANSLPLVEGLPSGKTDRFEVWFSQFSNMGGYWYPARTDYLAQAGMAGSFVCESSGPPHDNEPVSERLPNLPWFEGNTFQPGWEPHRPSLYVGVEDLPRFRARLSAPPWRDWRRVNMMAAAWGTAAHWLDEYVPSFSSPLSLAMLLTTLAVGSVFLLWRRHRIFKRQIPVKLILVWGTIWLLILFSGIAQIQLAKAPERSLIALHVATRYAVTGSSLHAATARDLLQDLPQSQAPRTLIERADACQAYALAYDLISPTIRRNTQAQIERNLFDYAAPLYGALQGWRSNRSTGSRFAAAVGMAGLAIGSETYVSTARETVERLLKSQLSGGLHREGPGAGSAALDAVANFLYALKHTGRADYYRSDAFLDYVRTTLQWTSPVGTLPLFEGTSLDHAFHAVPFLLKAANQVPQELGSQCVTTYETYWRLGRYSTRGLSKLLVDLTQSERFFLANPYTLFEYQEPEPAGSLPAASAILADGQGAVLRAGRGRNAVYLALNARRTLLTEPARDMLGFDLYAYNGLLLHGPGVPAPGDKAYPSVFQTSACNCIAFDSASQTGTQSTGVAAAMLNQPLFDYVRVLADRAYDQGQVQRDVVLVRPDGDHIPYFLLIDEIRAINPNAKVRWYLHGSGDAKLGVDKLTRWTSYAFEPPALRSTPLFLTVYPIGLLGSARTEPDRLYFPRPFFNQIAETLVLEWSGSQRFCAALMPRTAATPEVAFNPIPGLDSCKIGTTDWISLGTPETRTHAGPFRHVSEYTVVRQRGNGFPAVLMIGGLEFGIGAHSLVSNKPVFASLDGLRGNLVNYRPETLVEIHSPEIEAGSRFFLDEKELTASEPGKLTLPLNDSGEHRLRRAP
jgi:hypothetical protein